MEHLTEIVNLLLRKQTLALAHEMLKFIKRMHQDLVCDKGYLGILIRATAIIGKMKIDGKLKTFQIISCLKTYILECHLWQLENQNAGGFNYGGFLLDYRQNFAFLIDTLMGLENRNFKDHIKPFINIIVKEKDNLSKNPIHAIRVILFAKWMKRNNVQDSEEVNAMKKIRPENLHKFLIENYGDRFRDAPSKTKKLLKYLFKKDENCLKSIVQDYEESELPNYEDTNKSEKKSKSFPPNNIDLQSGPTVAERMEIDLTDCEDTEKGKEELIPIGSQQNTKLSRKRILEQSDSQVEIEPTNRSFSEASENVEVINKDSVSTSCSRQKRSRNVDTLSPPIDKDSSGKMRKETVDTAMSPSFIEAQSNQNISLPSNEYNIENETTEHVSPQIIQIDENRNKLSVSDTLQKDIDEDVIYLSDSEIECCLNDSNLITHSPGVSSTVKHQDKSPPVITLSEEEKEEEDLFGDELFESQSVEETIAAHEEKNVTADGSIYSTPQKLTAVNMFSSTPINSQVVGPNNESNMSLSFQSTNESFMSQSQSKYYSISDSPQLSLKKSSSIERSAVSDITLVDKVGSSWSEECSLPAESVNQLPQLSSQNCHQNSLSTALDEEYLSNETEFHITTASSMDESSLPNVTMSIGKDEFNHDDKLHPKMFEEQDLKAGPEEKTVDGDLLVNPAPPSSIENGKSSQRIGPEDSVPVTDPVDLVNVCASSSTESSSEIPDTIDPAKIYDLRRMASSGQSVVIKTVADLNSLPSEQYEIHPIGNYRLVEKRRSLPISNSNSNHKFTFRSCSKIQFPNSKQVANYSNDSSKANTSTSKSASISKISPSLSNSVSDPIYSTSSPNDIESRMSLRSSPSSANRTEASPVRISPSQDSEKSVVTRSRASSAGKDDNIESRMSLRSTCTSPISNRRKSRRFDCCDSSNSSSVGPLTSNVILTRRSSLNQSSTNKDINRMSITSPSVSPKSNRNKSFEDKDCSFCTSASSPLKTPSSSTSNKRTRNASPKLSSDNVHSPRQIITRRMSARILNSSQKAAENMNNSATLENSPQNQKLGRSLKSRNEDALDISSPKKTETTADYLDVSFEMDQSPIGLSPNRVEFLVKSPKQRLLKNGDIRTMLSNLTRSPDPKKRFNLRMKK